MAKTELYSAKTIFTDLGIPYKGRASLDGVTTYKKAPIKTQVGGHTIAVHQFALNATEVKKVAKHYGKDASVLGFNVKPNKDTTKQVQKLEKTISDMKVVLSKLVTQGTTSEKILPTQGVSAKVVKNDPLQIQARKQIRELVQDYASTRANELGIQDESRRLFFDLSFKALYNAYKESTPNKIDLKALADAESATGTKVSGLQIAERLGLAIELYQFAKAFYKQN